MKNMNNEPMKLLKSGTETNAGIAGQKRVGMRVNLGKGGQVVGKWTGFSHIEPASTRLFPHNSTQVVDFPRMYAARVFLRGVKFSFQSQAKFRTNQGGDVGGEVL